jgi:dipeptidyl aminopeptidase/acylaminoacyl peptidase
MRHSINGRLIVFSLILLISVCATLPTRSSRAQTAGQAASAAFTVEDLLDVVNTNVADLSDDGRWIVATSASLRDRIGVDNYRFGDPTYLAPSVADVWIIETQTGKAQKLFPSKRQVQGLRWSPDGARLALMVRASEVFEPMIWERATGKLIKIELPKGKYLTGDNVPQWSPDGAQLLLTLRSEEWRKKARERFEHETKGPIVVHSSKEPFLAWEEVRRLSALRSLAVYDIKSGQMRELLPEGRLNSYDLTDDGKFITYTQDLAKKTEYETGGGDNQVQIMPAGGGEARMLFKSTRGLSLTWARDGRHYVYTKDGNLFFSSIEDKEARQLTGKKEEKKDEKTAPPAEKPPTDKPKDDAGKDSDKEKEQKERFSAVRLSSKGDWLIASNKEGLWLMDTATGAKEMFLKHPPEEDKEAPRYQVFEWTPDNEQIYLTYASRTKWERGLYRYNVKAKRLEELFKDARLYTGYRMAKDGRTFVFAATEGNRPGDLYVADADFKNVRRLVETNPQLKDKRLSKTELISYLDVDGNKLYGVLYYPANYEPGKKYPTVFNIYEQFFDNTFNGTINVLTANGYAVMQPSVNFEIGFPSEAWTKGVTAAANKLIEMGIADPDRLGVQGTSYGGYATNLLITETSRFKAAINISGKVNMVSFYTDSPRLGTRNITAPERSQDRLGATLWQQPQKYIQHSAIMFADRIKTPLLLMTGEQDANVPARQAMEMYYALRRLGKEVEWVNYINGGHGMPTSTVEEVKDYHQRILRWYDDHLKADPKKKAAETKAEGVER